MSSTHKSHLHTDELKPCPLCGGRPGLHCFERGGDWGGEWEIDCPSCGLSLRTYFIQDIGKPKKKDSKAFNRELAITRWNKRKKSE